MAETEREDKRPSCGWPITEKLSTGGTTTRSCGSEEKVYNVTGKGLYSGRLRESKVCQKHLADAWKKWNVDSAIPVNPL